jgi:hypothetical protein
MPLVAERGATRAASDVAQPLLVRLCLAWYLMKNYLLQMLLAISWCVLQQLLAQVLGEYPLPYLAVG